MISLEQLACILNVWKYMNLTSRRVTLIDLSGPSSICVGVFRGMAFYRLDQFYTFFLEVQIECIWPGYFLDAYNAVSLTQVCLLRSLYGEETSQGGEEAARSQESQENRTLKHASRDIAEQYIKGDFKDSRPWRWSLWTWLRKHANGGVLPRMVRK